MIYFLCIVLFAIGLYGVLRKRNLIKIIVGLIIVEYAVHLLFILVGYRQGGRSPILAPDQEVLSILPTKDIYSISRTTGCTLNRLIVLL